MTPVITVFTKSETPCSQCDMTKRVLSSKGVEFIEVTGIDTPLHRDMLTAFMEMGHRSAPIVTVETEEGEILDSWSGFRPDLIERVAGRNE